MNILKNIVEWNRERGLLDREFNLKNEASFIIEELMESTGSVPSEEAREEAKKVADQIITKEAEDEIHVVDAFADIIVYATGAIAKKGYDPELVMEEVLKEINSRTGKLVDGKFIKDPDAKRYIADFSNCKNK